MQNQRIPVEKVQAAIQDLDSKDPYTVVRGLNVLTLRSHESSDGHVLMLESFPSLILSLGSLLDAINPLGCLLFSNSSQDFDSYCVDREVVPWSQILPSYENIAYKNLARTIDDNTMLLTVLTIFRNMSMEPLNEATICNSAPVLCHVVSIAMIAVERTHISTCEAATIAIDILCNIAQKIDVTGKRRLYQTPAWLEDTTPNTFNKGLLHLRLAQHMSEASSCMYMRTALSALPLAYHLICQNYHRNLLLKGLEIIAKLSTVDNVRYILRSPESLFTKLIELLCVSQHVGDPLTHSSLSSADLTSRSPVIFVGTPFFPEMSDLEVRDACVEAIWSMCSVASELSIRLAKVPFCAVTLLRICEMRAGMRMKTEGMLKAFQALSIMAGRAENRLPMMTIHSQLVVSACCGDDTSADLLCLVNPLVQNSLDNSLIGLHQGQLTGVRIGMELST